MLNLYAYYLIRLKPLSALQRIAGWLILLCAAHAVQAHTFERLFDDSRTLTLAAPLQWQVLPAGSVQNPEEFAQDIKNQAFRVLQHDRPLPTTADNEVWLRFALPATGSTQVWYLRIARTSVERATLFVQNDEGKWLAQTAGDSVAMRQWPERTLTPSFQLNTGATAERVYFLRLENRQPITEPLQMVAPSDYIAASQLVGGLIGLMVGLFGLMILLGLITARIARNGQYAWFAMMVVFLLMAQLVLAGYAGFRLWPDSIYLNRVMPVVMPLWALVATTWFVTQVSYARQTAPILFRISLALMTLIVCLSLTFAVMLERFPREILAPAAGLVLLWNFSVLVKLAWHAQTRLWWVAAGFAPLTLAFMARLAYTLGWLAHVEVAHLLSVIAGCLGMIAVYIGMVLRSRESFVALEREEALARTDTDTGLSLARIALGRLPDVLLRSKRFGKPCGVVIVRWLGYDTQLAQMSSSQRGAVMAHFGARLRRLARDIDTVARLDDDHFLYLIESPVSREALNDLGIKILTTCMRPSVQLGGGDIYNVHVAIGLQNGNNMSGNEVLEALRTRINQMDLNTPRRVQFVDSPLSTRPAGEGVEGTGALTSQEIVDKINRLEAIPLEPTLAQRASPEPIDDMVGRSRP